MKDTEILQGLERRQNGIGKRAVMVSILQMHATWLHYASECFVAHVSNFVLRAYCTQADVYLQVTMHACA